MAIDPTFEERREISEHTRDMQSGVRSINRSKGESMEHMWLSISTSVSLMEPVSRPAPSTPSTLTRDEQGGSENE